MLPRAEMTSGRWEEKRRITAYGHTEFLAEMWKRVTYKTGLEIRRRNNLSLDYEEF